MNVARRVPMTLPQFLEWEERQELRHEFDGLRPIAMTGGTFAHDQINMNLLSELRARLAGKPCRPSGPNMKVEVAGRIRYPDAFVHCAPVPPTARVVREPVVIFEILSESNSDTDLVEKNQEYRATPSVRRYVVIQQTHQAAIVFTRQGDAWNRDPYTGPEAIIPMPEIGIELPLAALYADVELVGDGDSARDMQ